MSEIAVSSKSRGTSDQNDVPPRRQAKSKVPDTKVTETAKSAKTAKSGKSSKGGQAKEGSNKKQDDGNDSEPVIEANPRGASRKEKREKSPKSDDVAEGKTAKTTTKRKLPSKKVAAAKKQVSKTTVEPEKTEEKKSSRAGKTNKDIVVGEASTEQKPNKKSTKKPAEKEAEKEVVGNEVNTASKRGSNDDHVEAVLSGSETTVKSQESTTEKSRSQKRTKPAATSPRRLRNGRESESENEGSKQRVAKKSKGQTEGSRVTDDDATTADEAEGSVEASGSKTLRKRKRVSDNVAETAAQKKKATSKKLAPVTEDVAEEDLKERNRVQKTSKKPAVYNLEASDSDDQEEAKAKAKSTEKAKTKRTDAKPSRAKKGAKEEDETGPSNAPSTSTQPAIDSAVASTRTDSATLARMVDEIMTRARNSHTSVTTQEVTEAVAKRFSKPLGESVNVELRKLVAKWLNDNKG